MPDNMSKYMSGRMPDKMSKHMLARMPKRKPDKMSKHMSARMPKRKPDKMSESMSTKCENGRIFSPRWGWLAPFTSCILACFEGLPQILSQHLGAMGRIPPFKI